MLRIQYAETQMRAHMPQADANIYYDIIFIQNHIDVQSK